MTDLDSINTFISKIEQIFPETIEYKDTEEKEVIGERTLKRQILYIDESKPTVTTSNDRVILKQFLKILDINLGGIYKRVSYQIYDNRKSWKYNKWEEMLSPGLIYVSYWDMDTEDVMLFLSFMLTEEMDVSKRGVNEVIVYLYEIQLLPKIRRIGIGQRLMRCLKESSIEYNKSATNINSRIKAIVLTVFSENEKAINFYRKLQFQFTVGSPRDEPIDRIANRTRKRQNIDRTTTTTTINQEVIKPIYYLLYLAL